LGNPWCRRFDPNRAPFEVRPTEVDRSATSELAPATLRRGYARRPPFQPDGTSCDDGDLCTLCGITPTYLTFCEEGAGGMEAVLAQVNADLGADPGYGGIAIHHYGSCADMAP